MKRVLRTASLAAAAVLAGLLGCTEPTHPGTGGGLSLQFDASAAAWDSVKIFVSGPTNKNMKVTPGTTATIDGLVAGRYTVAIEAFSSGGVVSLFQTADVNIVANQNASVTPTMADFVSFVPVMGSLPSTGTSTTFTVTYSSVAGAASYEAEAATDVGFTTNRTAATSTTTSAQITVPTFATYFVRVRAIDAYQGRGQPSPPQTIQLAATPPVAPGALSATAASNNQINLAWTDNANNEDGFQIERCAGVSCGGFVQIATVGPNATTYSSAGLTSATSYSYRVRAYNGAGSSGYSNTATAVTFTVVTVPAAPSGLTATTASNTQINLSWTDNANNEDVFQIERCTGVSCSSFAQIATVGPNVTTYQNTGLTASTSYSYRVRANNTAGNSLYTNTGTAVTAATVVIPVAPTNLTATSISPTQINLAWTDNADNEDGFQIERCTGPSCANFTQIATVGPNVTTYPNTGLTASTSYSYRVRAYNTAGSSAYSNTAPATTAPTLPAAPTSLTALAVSPSQINLSWTDNSNNEDGFQIERCQGASCSSFVQIVTVGPNVTTYQNTGLTAGTSYSYRVRAINATGLSTYSNTATATTTATPPADPTLLTATAVSASQINLSWTDNADNEDGFQIERCTGASCSNFAQIGTALANATTFQNTGLSASTTYSYRVRANNTGGTSGYSNTVPATTPVAAPAAPTSLTASTVSASQINLSWTDNSNNEDGFQIERCQGASCSNFVQIATVLANVTTYQNTELTAATSYSYRVRANNAGGSSAYSNPATAVTAITPPAAPTGLTATAVSSSQINLGWTDNATNEAGFEIERCTGDTCVNFVQIATVGPNVTAYSNTTGLSASTAYAYRVRATNTGGASAYSNTATATTLVPPPAAPTALTATGVSTSQINLAWTDNATNEDGYYVERCTGAACVNFAQIQIVGPNATSYQDTGLTAGTTYRYQVRAYNTGGVSGYSNIANGTTIPNPPAAPTSLTVTSVSGSRVTIGWMDNSLNEDGFQIERCTGATCTTFALLTSVVANTTSYANMGLAGSTTYRYQVRAYNTGGTSAYTNIVNGTTN